MLHKMLKNSHFADGDTDPRSKVTYIPNALLSTNCKLSPVHGDPGVGRVGQKRGDDLVPALQECPVQLWKE